MKLITYVTNLIKMFPKITYNQAFVLYAIFIVIWFWPFIVGGQVIAPCIESTVDKDVIESMFEDEIPYISRNTPNCVEHSDYRLVYIPEAHQMLNSDYYHWIPTWIAEVGFGGMMHLSRGTSANYFPTYIVSLLTDDPYVFFTLIHMAYVFLAGFVFVAYMKLLRLHPLASLLGGITYATLPIFTFWATQTPFYLHAVWFIVLLYLLQRLVTDQRLWVIILLALSIHSALLTTYPQALIILATVMAVFVVYLLIRVIHSNDVRIKYVMLVGSATVVGVLLTVPVWLDFLNITSQVLRNPRVGNLPPFPIEEPRVILSYFFPEVFSVIPLLNRESVYIKGYYVTLIITVFSLYGFISSARKLMPLVSGLFIMGLISFEPTIGGLYNQYLTVGISPWVTMFLFYGPLVLVIISTFGLHHFIESWWSERNARFEIGITIVLVGVMIDIFVRAGMASDWQPRWITLIAMVLVLISTYITTFNRLPLRFRAWLFAGAFIWATISATFLAIPRMPIEYTAVMGEEITYIKSQLKTDEHMATVSDQNVDTSNWKCCLFLGNNYATYDIASIGQNAVVPMNRYQQLMENLGYPTTDKRKYYKRYYSITPSYDSLDYWMMNIGVVASKVEQQHPTLKFLTKIDGWYMYDADAKGCCLQINIDDIQLDNTSATQLEATYIDPRGKSIALQKDVRFEDYFEIPLAHTHASIVVISQLYDMEWDAYALVGDVWQKVDTFAMNGIYQAAVVPEGTTKIRFDFTPWVLWMWIPFLVWIVGITLCIMSVWFPHVLTRLLALPQTLKMKSIKQA
jgi:hypothetical protein